MGIMAWRTILIVTVFGLASCGGTFSAAGDGEPEDAPDSSDPRLDVVEGEDIPFDGVVQDADADGGDPVGDPEPEEEPCTPVPAPPATASEIFSRAGAIIAESTSAFPASAFGPTLRDNGFSWVSVQIINGEGIQEEASWSGWMEAWRCYLPFVGAWGVNRTAPEAEAGLAADLVAGHGFDFYIADAEYEYKYSQDSGTCGECFERSGRWITEFMGRLSGHGLADFPVALTSYGRVDLADLDWRSWSSAGFHFMPQTYWNDYDIYEPRACVEMAVTWIRPEMETSPFWTADQVHPMLGIWGGGVSRYVTGSQYVENLAAAQAAWGQVGFSVFRGDMCPSGEWPVLGEGIAAGLAVH
jgi:hypothetical protein